MAVISVSWCSTKMPLTKLYKHDRNAGRTLLFKLFTGNNVTYADVPRSVQQETYEPSIQQKRINTYEPSIQQEQEMRMNHDNTMILKRAIMSPFLTTIHRKKRSAHLSSEDIALSSEVEYHLPSSSHSLLPDDEYSSKSHHVASSVSDQASESHIILPNNHRETDSHHVLPISHQKSGYRRVYPNSRQGSETRSPLPNNHQESRRLLPNNHQSHHVASSVSDQASESHIILPNNHRETDSHHLLPISHQKSEYIRVYPNSRQGSETRSPLPNNHQSHHVASSVSDQASESHIILPNNHRETDSHHVLPISHQKSGYRRVYPNSRQGSETRSPLPNNHQESRRLLPNNHQESESQHLLPDNHPRSESLRLSSTHSLSEVVHVEPISRPMTEFVPLSPDSEHSSTQMSSNEQTSPEVSSSLVGHCPLTSHLSQLHTTEFQQILPLVNGQPSSAKKPETSIEGERSLCRFVLEEAEPKDKNRIPQLLWRANLVEECECEKVGGKCEAVNYNITVAKRKENGIGSLQKIPLTVAYVCITQHGQHDWFARRQAKGSVRSMIGQPTSAKTICPSVTTKTTGLASPKSGLQMCPSETVCTTVFRELPEFNCRHHVGWNVNFKKIPVAHVCAHKQFDMNTYHRPNCAPSMSRHRSL